MITRKSNLIQLLVYILKQDTFLVVYDDSAASTEGIFSPTVAIENVGDEQDVDGKAISNLI
ncbi:hypothetical protein AXF42_Ash001172 [Apostasia shenzhenica]|uniref:Uncharacterized protein n=1 Tax=Apostasia shenzhenica TaxID=1088818 RepID=A0A2I0AU48_9ASPA|nr:hypothetical protein AXF42_Ash001172 [Apostasia shenzhenica]